MFHIIISYFVVFHEVLFNVKSKNEGIVHLVQNKTGNQGYAHLPEILLQLVVLEHNGNTTAFVYLFVCCIILLCFTISPPAYWDGNYN